MKRLAPHIDPYANDPGHWGASLSTLGEVVLGCLDACGARSVVEVGAYAGDVTRLLLDWAQGAGARVGAIDPAPEPELSALADQRSDLELIRATSHEALRGIEMPDAIIIDGDHNYYTVSEELRIIAERTAGSPIPLLMFHDVCWPHARRDDYFSPEDIPAEHRQPLVQGGGLFPGVVGIRPGGLPFRWTAAREGGPGNGVLTAIEDFVETQGDLQLAVLPAFFGFGAVWPRDAQWAAAVADVLERWDGNPLLERLEANRVLHLASSHFMMVEANRWRERNARKEDLLRRLLQSRTFSVAVLLSRLRQRGEPAFSKDEVRRLLADLD